MKNDERSSAREPIFSGEFYHVRAAVGDVAEYVLLPGDPGRVSLICDQWDESKEISFNREFRLASGRVGSTKVSCCSTGIGGPSTAIAVEELARAGARTFFRVGSAGAIQPGIDCGDLIISSASVRTEGTSKQYVMAEYPAAANYEVILALVEACEGLGYRYHVGVTASVDSFYVGQNRPGLGGYFPSFSGTLFSDLQKARVLGFEMEASTIFTLASLYGLRAGAICAVFANRITDVFEVKGETEAVRAATEAVKILREWDGAKQRSKRDSFFPRLVRQNP